jgi:hypothetical protein
MKKNKTDIFIIIVFWFINKEDTDISTEENRTLSSKPKLEFATITQYPEKFDDYYNDHLPFRTNLRNLWTNLNYKLFYTTVDSRVLIGKENWLFYREDASIEQVRGFVKYSQGQQEEILANLQENVSKLKEKNIETYVLILPNKENIYREYLPNTVTIYDDVSRTEELINYIEENSDIDIIYPKQELLQAKEKYQIYRKYDTHWNKIGACIGAIALQSKIDSTFTYDMSNMQIEEIDEKDIKDLANFAGIGNILSENVVRVSNFYTDIEYTANFTAKYEEYISNSENDKTVMIIGDSFREDMREYFSKLYKRVIYLHRDNYSKELIEEMEPNIVVIESVERYSYSIGKKLFE